MNKCIRYFIDAASQPISLRQDISNMDKMMRFVNRKFTRLSPYRAQMRLNTPLKKQTCEPCVQKLGEIVDVNRSKCTSAKMSDILINDINGVKETKLGDCGESSAIMLSSLLANGYNDGEVMRLLIKAEALDAKTKKLLDVRIMDTTHEFVGRGFSDIADLENPKTYGKNAIVIDAWAGFCSNVQEALKKYYEIFLGGLREYAQPEHNVVIKYTPIFQKIVPKGTVTSEDAAILRKKFPELIV